MTAPTIIRGLIETSRNSVVINGQRANQPFPILKGGWVKDTTGKEGEIRQVDPLVVIANDDSELKGNLTPLYPYFNNGSVLKAVTNLDKTSDKRFPILVLDTLDKSETRDNLGYVDYNLRAYVAMLGINEDNADQFAEIYEQGLNELAEWVVSSLKGKMFYNETLTHRERWGDSSQYGRNDSNIFGDNVTDAIEITGDFKFNPEQLCQR